MPGRAWRLAVVVDVGYRVYTEEGRSILTAQTCPGEPLLKWEEGVSGDE